MKVSNKVFSDIQIREIAEDVGISLCYGHFSVIHPGHIRYLQHSKKVNSKLWVIVKRISNEDSGKLNYSINDRANSVASIEIVDKVITLDSGSLLDIVKQVRPLFLCLGNEFASERPSEIDEAINWLEKNGGKVEFHAGDVSYNTTDLLHADASTLDLTRTSKFIEICREGHIDFLNLRKVIQSFSEKKILVIGDTIVDQYIACDALGMSAEAPVIVVRELESKNYIGGAAIVAAHLAALGVQTKFISVTGQDDQSEFIHNELALLNVQASLFPDSSRPTTYKTRYVVENQKVFRVSRLKDHPISREIEDHILIEIESELPNFDGVVVSDFVYGTLTPRVLDHLVKLTKKYGLPIFGDQQSSSQIGNISRFQGFTYLFPTEKEARMGLEDNGGGIEWIANSLLRKTNSNGLVLKLGANGFLVYSDTDSNLSRIHIPSLVSNPVDVSGAGDSLLAAVAAGVCAKASILESSLVAACVAALAVQTMGNVAISKNRLLNYLSELEKINV